MDHFEENLSHDYFQETGSSPWVWFCFIDNIFCIRTSNEESVDNLITFTKNYSKSEDVKSKSKFEVYISSNRVYFVHVTVFKHKTWRTSLFDKPIFLLTRGLFSRKMPKTPQKMEVVISTKLFFLGYHQALKEKIVNWQTMHSVKKIIE